MSIWTDRVKTHQLWQNLEALGPVIDQALAREGADTLALEGLNRLKVALAFVGRRLAGADPYLLHPGPLDSISSVIQSATSEVQSFISNGSSGHITNANSHGDNALAYLAQLNVPVVTTDFVALRDAADSYRAAVEKNMAALDGTIAKTRKEFESLNVRLSELATEVTTEKQRLTSLASDYQLQFSAAQESRNKAHADAQEARQDKFTGILEDYSQKLSEQNLAFGKQREELLKQHEEDLTKFSKQYSESALGLLKEMETQKSQVEKLVGVIGNLGVTSGYQKTAHQARWHALVWQGIAIITLGSIVLMAYYLVLPLVQQDSFPWGPFATRVFLTLPIAVLAAYAISQADKYQQVERRSQKLALELEAIGPFLATLPSEKQEEFRLKIGERSFGTSQDLIDRHSIKSPSSLVDLIPKNKEAREFITELIKAIKS